MPAILAVPRGSRIKPGALSGALSRLDIDEGVRLERGKIKMFVNRGPSGTFVVQLGDSQDFAYLKSARQVAALARSKLGGRASAWAY